MATFAGRYDEPLLKFANGRLTPATSATVTVYESDGVTLADIYTSRTKTTPLANPITPDGFGNLQFFADPGTYVLSMAEGGSVQDTHEVTVPFDPEEVSGGGVTSVNGVAGDVTAAQLLTAIKTVDGSGSGLDADLLDGNDPSAFATSGHAHDYAATGHTHSYQPLDPVLTNTTASFTTADETKLDGIEAGATTDQTASEIVGKFTGTPTGAKYLRDDGTLAEPAGGGGGGATNLAWNAGTSTVTSDTGTDATLTAVDGSNPGLMTVAQSTKLAGIETAATADQTAAELLTAIKTVDGTGSGLDADTVDGLNSTAFQPVSTDLTAIDNANNGTVLAATTASFTTADETKLDALPSDALSTATAPELIRDTMGTALVAGTNVTITPNDGADTITIAASGGGSSSGVSPLAPVNSTGTAQYLAMPGYHPVARDIPHAFTSGVQRTYPMRLDGPLTLTSVGISISVAGAAGTKFYCWLYNATNGDMQPTSLVLDVTAASGGFVADTTGAKEITGLSQVLPAGRYVWQLHPVGGNPTLLSVRYAPPALGIAIGNTWMSFAERSGVSATTAPTTGVPWTGSNNSANPFDIPIWIKGTAA